MTMLCWRTPEPGGRAAPEHPDRFEPEFGVAPGASVPTIGMEVGMTDTKRLGFDSKLVHAGAPKDAYGSAVTPIYQTSTFRFDSAQDGADRFAGRSDGFIYTRLGNPTICALETCIAEIEEGAGAVATSSGMGAVTTAYLALLAGGDHIVSTAAVYGPSRTLMEKHLSRFGLAATYVDTSELGLVRSAMRRSTKASRSGATVGSRADGGRGARSRWACRSAAVSVSAKGRRPVRR